MEGVYFEGLKASFVGKLSKLIKGRSEELTFFLTLKKGNFNV